MPHLSLWKGGGAIADTGLAERGHDLEYFSITLAQVDHALDLSGSGVAEDVVGCDLARGDGHIQPQFSVDFDVCRAVDDAAYSGRAEALGQKGAHHIVLVVFGDGKVQVRAVHIFFAQLLDVGAITEGRLPRVSTTSWPIAGWASKARAGRLIIGSPATGTSGLTGTPAAVASGSAIGRAPASRIAVMVAGSEDVMPAR